MLARKIYNLVLTNIGIGLSFLTTSYNCWAQNIPDSSIKEDNSLGAESSYLEQSTILGGARRGSTRFHSFSQFNILEGQSVYFNPGAGIDNIVTRVTGKNGSNIYGTLGIKDSNANLFFINPNGITFGNSAKLELKGSFFASTASSVVFDNQFEFSASSPNLPSNILTINTPPIGLRFGELPGTIQSRAEDIRVSQGNTLGLIGGEILIDGTELDNGAAIFAPGGNIEIGSVSGKNLVKFYPSDKGWIFDYKNVVGFENISLNGVFISTSEDLNSQNSGSIYFTGKQIEIINSDINTLNYGVLGGNISYNSESLTIDSSYVTTSSAPKSTGQAGDIYINVKQLSIGNGSIVNASSYGDGVAGNININADSIEIHDASRLASRPFAQGNSGNINITTSKLILSNGGTISVTSKTTGDAGNIEINARDIFLNNGLIDAQSNAGKGNIVLNAENTLILGDESQISTNAIGSANGGNITINASILLALPPTGSAGNGNDILSRGVSGNGGNININAQGVFGIENRPATSGNNTNDIDARSDFGVSGQVQINTSTDVNQGLVELPTTVIDPNMIVSQQPCDRGWNSSFTLNGRGGVPQTPKQDLSAEAVQIGLVEAVPIEQKNATKTSNQIIASQSLKNLQQPIEKTVSPAQGWIYNNKGEVALVAYNPTLTAQQRLQQHAVCSANK